MEILTDLLQSNKTVEKTGIYVTNDIANVTVWDTLAQENPTHAVISAGGEEEAATKSADQIADIASHVDETTVLLDYGSGYGRVAKYLLPKQTLAGYIGLDSSYQMLQIFKERYDREAAEQTTPVIFLNADIHSIPLESDSVDVVIVCAVFLHNHKSIVEKSLQELARVVKPGGKVLVYSSFPRTYTCMGLQGHVYQMLLNLLGRPFKNGPVRYYTKKEVMRLFSNFSTIDVMPVGFSVIPKSIIFLPRALDNIWRVVIANQINLLLEIVIPKSLHRHFAVHFDVIAKR